ncbi:MULTISPECIES: RNA polymerase sigma factor [Prosthecochloris]|uniref:Sigma-70 family RNA polymerase sigma factor n=1 Tax=Prosthecochloris vibrioformis TaxID=1098 RepID=A0A5C4RSH5_PROVB|nr:MULTISPECIES: sigma-70 family RNA polymerase sigma factor [Prosthecochloris]ANT64717.1 Sigma-W factor [Prosthecochloris sp. CIB 2401]TNJ34146.1 sigma-70 family RNA polymerase sigma factor [Prosthecochloris vibrioformis]
MIPEIDREISQRFHNGDREALEVIVATCQGSLFGIGLKMLGGIHDAKDFVQDVCIKIYNKRSLYNPELPFAPWMYKIAINLARERLRNRKEFPGSDSMPAEIIEETPRHLLVDQEQSQAVHTILQQLEPKYRECLVLRFEMDMALKEIATTLDLPVGTVKTRLRRGLMAFREQWLKNGDPQ